MSEPIGPGDLVECLVGINGTVAGAFYCVAALTKRVGRCAFDGCAEPGLALEGVVPTSARNGHCVHRFRPISRRSDFEAFLARNQDAARGCR